MHQQLTELGKLNSQITFGIGRFSVLLNVDGVDRFTLWLAVLLLIVSVDGDLASWNWSNNSPLLKTLE
jgi:hypothetical protein